MRWDPREDGYYTSLQREQQRMQGEGFTEYQARLILALERIATQLEDSVVWHTGPLHL